MPKIHKITKQSDDTTFVLNKEIIPVVNAPEDTNWTKWSMLNDRKSTRLYFFKKDSADTLYPFLFDGNAFTYDVAFPQIKLLDIPEDANTEHIAMLSTPNFEKVNGVNGKELPVPNNYHLYMQQESSSASLQGNFRFIYQFIWEKNTANLERNGITSDMFKISDFPQDTDWNRWTMTYDSNRYQLALEAYVLVAFKKNSYTELYQGRYGKKDNGEASYTYEKTLHLKDVPQALTELGLAMIFDGVQTHFYALSL